MPSLKAEGLQTLNLMQRLTEAARENVLRRRRERYDARRGAPRPRRNFR
jgi:hypothetical protein